MRLRMLMLVSRIWGMRNWATGNRDILTANHRANGAREYIGLASQTSG